MLPTLLWAHGTLALRNAQLTRAGGGFVAGNVSNDNVLTGRLVARGFHIVSVEVRFVLRRSLRSEPAGSMS